MRERERERGRGIIPKLRNDMFTENGRYNSKEINWCQETGKDFPTCIWKGDPHFPYVYRIYPTYYTLKRGELSNSAATGSYNFRIYGDGIIAATVGGTSPTNGYADSFCFYDGMKEYATTTWPSNITESAAPDAIAGRYLPNHVRPLKTLNGGGITYGTVVNPIVNGIYYYCELVLTHSRIIGLVQCGKLPGNILATMV